MADTESGAQPVQISDVAQPGMSAPSASSKPILITNRPVMKDPMMIDEDGNRSDEGGAPPLSHLTITPLTANETAETNDTPTQNNADTAGHSGNSSTRVDDDSTADPASKTSETPSESTTDSSDPAETSKDDSDLTVDDEANRPVPTNHKSDEADVAAAELRAKELDDLADSHKYYLSINQVEKRKAQRYAWAGILLILLLAVAWADIAADAGIVNLPGFNPVTHFFSN